MATRTITLEIEAYEKLRRAKRNVRESFSSVVRRARWDDTTPLAGDILRGLRADVEIDPGLLLAEPDLDRIARRRRPPRQRTAWEGR